MKGSLTATAVEKRGLSVRMQASAGGGSVGARSSVGAPGVQARVVKNSQGVGALQAATLAATLPSSPSPLPLVVVVVVLWGSA